MIVSISGKPGSGKSTIAQRLADALGYKRYYIGGLRRAMAAERGLTLEQLNALGEREEWTDREVDAYQRKLGETEDNFVIEGRTSFFLIPHSFKIFLDVDSAEGSKRILGAMHHGERSEEAGPTATVDEIIAMTERRIASDAKRYKQYYQIDNIFDPKHYDFVLDTTHLTRDEVFAKVEAAVRARQRPKSG